MRVAAQNLESGTDFVNTVVNGFQLCRLVQHIFGRGDFAAVVQPCRQMESVPFVFGHFKVGKRAVLVHHRRQSQLARDNRNALAMRARVRRFVVNRAGDDFQKCLQHVFLRFNQLLVVNGDRGVRRQRFNQLLHGFGKKYRFPVLGAGVNQLQNGDHLPRARFQRYGQKRFRPIARRFIELLRSRKIKILGIVGVGNIDDLFGQSGVRRHVFGVRFARFGIVQIQRRKRNFLFFRRSAHFDSQSVSVQNGKNQLMVGQIGQVKRSRFGV